MGQIAGRFPRVEPRRRVRQLVLGLLSDLPRKNCWPIAEWAGGPGTHPGRFAAPAWGAKCDAAQVRDDLRGYVLDHLADDHAVLVVDDTGK